MSTNNHNSKPTLLYSLKIISALAAATPENPLTAADIFNLIDDYDTSTKKPGEKTVRDHLAEMANFFSIEDNPYLRSMAELVLHGKISCIQKVNANAYYIEPFKNLSSDDINLNLSKIVSNYSVPDSSPFGAAVSYMSGTANNVNDTKSTTYAMLSGISHNYHQFEKLSVLYDAIQNKKVVTFNSTDSVTLSKNAYSPYALVFYDNKFYVICSRMSKNELIHLNINDCNSIDTTYRFESNNTFYSRYLKDGSFDYKTYIQNSFCK